MNWDSFFIKMAQFVAQKSKDRSTQVGVVIVGDDNQVLSIGYNGFPRNVDDDIDDRHERPQKYQYTEHAERNSIYNCALSGIKTKDARMYFNFYPEPCTDCARAIIQSGIKELIGSDIPFPGKGQQWKKDLEIAKEMLNESGIKRRIIRTKE